MTLAASVAKQIYDGNGVATNFSFPHFFWGNTELVVKHKSIGGTITTLVLDTDYTVNGVGTATGSVDFPKVGSSFDTLATGEKLMIRRVQVKERTPDLSGSFFFGTANTGGDKQTGMIQELSEILDRAVIYDEFYEDTVLTAEQMAALGEGVLDGVVGWDFNGLGDVISTGIYYKSRPMPYDCTIENYTLLADQVGSIVIDLWKDTFANYPPTVADSICGSALPTLSSAQKAQVVAANLTGWTLSLSKGDIIIAKVNSAATITQATLSLKLLKSGS